MIRRLLRLFLRRKVTVVGLAPRRLTPSTLGSLTREQRLSYLACCHAMTTRKDGIQ